MNKNTLKALIGSLVILVAGLAIAQQEVMVGSRAVSDTLGRMASAKKSLSGAPKVVSKKVATAKAKPKVGNAKVISKYRAVKTISGDVTVTPAERAFPYVIGSKISTAILMNQLEAFQQVRDEIKPLVDAFQDTPMQDDLKLALEESVKSKPDGAAIEKRLASAFRTFFIAYKTLDEGMAFNMRVGAENGTLAIMIMFLSEPQLKETGTKQIKEIQETLKGLLLDSPETIDPEFKTAIKAVVDAKIETKAITAACVALESIYVAKMK